MSRLGKKPLPIPDKVKIEQKSNTLEISGPLGKMVQPLHEHVDVKIEKNQVTVSVKSGSREDNMLHGLYRGILKNAIEGVTVGFKKILEIQGLGYKAAQEGKNVTLNVGFSHPISFPIPEGIKVAIEKNTIVTISGVDKALVGEVAASMRALQPPEPYKGTGIRYAGEHIIRKEGKAAAGAAGGAGGGGKK
jgi:large subunit ribosomal protein L6